MTLVLATIAGDSVVFGADSKIQVIDAKTRQPVPGPPTTDRKLFKFARVGIATYGDGPPEHVPTVIDALRSECNIMEAVEFMRNHFQHAKGMGALIGGLDERGNPMLFDFPMSQQNPHIVAPELGRLSPLVHRGINGQLDLDPPGTPASAIAQMLTLLSAHAGAYVGPPFEFLVISHPRI